MPLSRIQIEVLKLLAAHRDPESYVAGATPLNLKGPRYSGDIDVFHDVVDFYGVQVSRWRNRDLRIALL